MLGASGLAEIAQDLVDSYYGTESYEYRAQYTGFKTGDTVVSVPVVKRRTA